MTKVNILNIVLVALIGIFSVIYFIIANKISYNFQGDFVNDLYDLKMESISMQAQIYGDNNPDLFNENKDVYITVDELAQNDYVLNNDGVVIDPRDETKTLNDLKIKLTYENEKVTAKILG